MSVKFNFVPALLLALSLAVVASFIPSAWSKNFLIKGTKGTNISATPIAEFNAPWAMAFINEGQMLVTTKPGKLWLTGTNGEKEEVSGVPKVAGGGQGGLGDVLPHPDFAKNKRIYLSLIESKDGGRTRGAVVYSARLDLAAAPRLTGLKKIWTQLSKARGKGHFSHRLAFGPAGTSQAGKLFITSGDRQAQSPAQRWDMALGKIIRLNADGSVPDDNPWQNKGELAKSYWTTGHRNPLGIAFDADGRLWANEMGPKHGDELNLIEPANNYGWPEVSEGNQYSGRKIPNHDTRPEFTPPKAAWVPSIAPSSLMIYSGDKFPGWKGDALIGGLVSRALIHVDLAGDNASEAERFKWGKRIREVEQSPSGEVYVLEDKKGGRLLRLNQP